MHLSAYTVRARTHRRTLSDSQILPLLASDQHKEATAKIPSQKRLPSAHGKQLGTLRQVGHSHDVDRVAVQPAGNGKRTREGCSKIWDQIALYDRPRMMTIGESLEIA
jgi:hypothetical protein